MARIARSTVKAQRDKLARFAANRVFLQAKPSATRVGASPKSASVTPYPSGRDDRAGACLVGR